MSRAGAAVVVAGQGSLRRAPFDSGVLRSQLREVFEEIGPAGSGAARLCDGPLATPERLSLFVLAASVAHYRVLHGLGLRPVAFVGHGFGEVIALVCAGALSPAQGADIVRHRTAALESSCDERGRMIVIRTGPATADRLIEQVGRDRVSVAAENGPTEIVISGTASGIEEVATLATRRGVVVKPLNARWALHCERTMRRAADELAGRLGRLDAAAPSAPVFSPALGRYYRRSDDLGSSLAEQLTMPVRFADAIAELWAEGIRTYIPCGPLRGLDRSIDELVRRNRPHGVLFPAIAFNRIEDEKTIDIPMLAS